MGKDATRYDCPLSARHLTALVRALHRMKATGVFLSPSTLDGLAELEMALASVGEGTEAEWAEEESKAELEDLRASMDAARSAFRRHFPH